MKKICEIKINDICRCKRTFAEIHTCSSKQPGLLKISALLIRFFENKMITHEVQLPRSKIPRAFLFHSLLVSTATASPLQGLPQTAASIHVPSSIIIHRNWGSDPSWWIIIRRTCFGPVCYLQFVTMTGSFACFLLLLFFLHWVPFLMQPTNGFVSSPRLKPGIFCLWD